MNSKLRSLLWILPVAPIAISLWVETRLSRPSPEPLLQRMDMSEVVRSVAPTEARPPIHTPVTSVQGATTQKTLTGSHAQGSFETRLFLANPQEPDYGSRLCSAVEEAMGRAGARVQGKQGGSDTTCTLAYRNESRQGELDVIVTPDSGSSRHVLIRATETEI